MVVSDPEIRQEDRYSGFVKMREGSKPGGQGLVGDGNH